MFVYISYSKIHIKCSICIKCITQLQLNSPQTESCFNIGSLSYMYVKIGKPGSVSIFTTWELIGIF